MLQANMVPEDNIASIGQDKKCRIFMISKSDHYPTGWRKKNYKRQTQNYPTNICTHTLPQM